MTKPFALIVEDDPVQSQVFSLSLQPDFETELIPDGSQALARLAEVVPDLIILDLHLPGASGTTILQHIRADSRLAGVRVILATADAREAETLESEADLVLLKPVSPIQLRSLATRLKG